MSRRILIVDDDRIIRVLLTQLLEGEHEVQAACDGNEAIQMAEQWRPHLVLLDVSMPVLNGYEVCRRLKNSCKEVPPQVIMVTGRSAEGEQVHAFTVGADDFIAKPFDRHELQARIALHLRLHDAEAQANTIRQQIDGNHAELRRQAEIQSRQIAATQEVAVFSLAKAAELRDETTGEHILRIQAYAQGLAETLAAGGPYADQVDQRFLDNLHRSSPLHDIGKLGIPDSILRKPGPLTPEEFEIMKQHTVIGANLLDQAVFRSTCGGFLGMAAVIARFHHEKFNGRGYPAGLVGEEIPLPARIVAVADVFDALTSRRPYKPPYPVAQAREMIERDSGSHFDPVIVAAFQQCYDSFLQIHSRHHHEPDIAVGAMAFQDSPSASALAWSAAMTLPGDSSSV